MESWINEELGDWEVLDADTPQARARLLGRRIDVRLSSFFGATDEIDEVVLDSLQQFLARNPGELDHLALRYVAAAAPSIGDNRLVARLIDELPVTGMYISVRRPDLAELQAAFADTFHTDEPRGAQPYRPLTRFRLVSDLIQKTLSEVIDNAPKEAVTAGAAEYMVTVLTQQMAGGLHAREGAAASQRATRTIVDDWLESAEDQVNRDREALDAWVRAGRPAGARPVAMPLPAYYQTLSAIITKDSSVTGAEQLTRVYRVAQRSMEHYTSPDYAVEDDAVGNDLWRASRDDCAALLQAIALNPVVEEQTLLDSLRDLERVTSLTSDDDLTFLGNVLRLPDLPESVPRALLFDQPARLNLLLRRENHRWPSHEAGIAGDGRLLALRLHRWAPAYIQGDVVTTKRPILDHAVANLPPRFLVPAAVYAIEDESALADLAARDDLSPTTAIWAMRSPHAPSRLLPDLATKVAERRAEAIGVSPSATEQQLIDAMTMGRPRDRLHSHTAAEHPAAGTEVLHWIERHAMRAGGLPTMAACTTQPNLQAELLEIAQRTRNAGIVAQLRNNPFLDTDVYEESRVVFPHDDHEPLIDWGNPRLVDRVAAFVVSGRARDAVIDEIVETAMRPPGLYAHANEEAIRALTLIAPSGRLRPIHWRKLTGLPDLHHRMIFATSPFAVPGTSAYEPTGAQLIARSATAARRGIPPTPERRGFGQLADLATTNDPFPDSRFADAIDNLTIDGLHLRVLRTRDQIAEAARYMRNCLDGFVNAANAGTVIIAMAQDETRDYAIAWQLDVNRIRLLEINSRFNRGDVTQEFRDGVDRFTRDSNELSRLDPSGLLPGTKFSRTLVPPAWHPDESDPAFDHRVFGTRTPEAAIAAIAVHAQRHLGTGNSENVRRALASVIAHSRDATVPIEHVSDPAEVRAILNGVARHLRNIGAAAGTYTAHETATRLSGRRMDREATRTGAVDKLYDTLHGLDEHVHGNVQRSISQLIGGRPRSIPARLREEVIAGAARGANEFLAQVPRIREADGDTRDARAQAVRDWRRDSHLISPMGEPHPLQPALVATADVLSVVPARSRDRFLTGSPRRQGRDGEGPDEGRTRRDDGGRSGPGSTGAARKPDAGEPVQVRGGQRPARRRGGDRPAPRAQRVAGAAPRPDQQRPRRDEADAGGAHAEGPPRRGPVASRRHRADPRVEPDVRGKRDHDRLPPRRATPAEPKERAAVRDLTLAPVAPAGPPARG